MFLGVFSNLNLHYTVIMFTCHMAEIKEQYRGPSNSVCHRKMGSRGTTTAAVISYCIGTLNRSRPDEPVRDTAEMLIINISENPRFPLYKAREPSCRNADLHTNELDQFHMRFADQQCLPLSFRSFPLWRSRHGVVLLRLIFPNQRSTRFVGHQRSTFIPDPRDRRAESISLLYAFLWAVINFKHLKQMDPFIATFILCSVHCKSSSSSKLRAISDLLYARTLHS